MEPFLKQLDGQVVAKSNLFQKFEFHYPDFFQMPNFELQIFMDYFWKNSSTTTFHEWKNSILAINDHMNIL